MELFKEWHGDTVVGVLLLIFEVHSIWSNWRFRKNALRVTGQVLKVIRYSKHISYYLTYPYEESTRVAEFSGPGVFATFKQGDSVEILVDPQNPPNVRVPEGSHIRWTRMGNCSLADSRLISMMDVVLIGAGGFLVVHGL